MRRNGHIDMLQQGAVAWNTWRAKHPNEKINLSGANLSRADLSGAYLNGTNLSGAHLSGAYLNGTDLSRADLSRADLSGAYLSGTDLSGANLNNTNLNGTDLNKANLSGANLSGANLSGANLNRVGLSGADLSGADLSGADLSGADLSDTNLNGTDLSGAHLRRADLSDADLSDADLSDADLSDTDLTRANLTRANLSGANLSGAYLSGANLSGANLNRVGLSRANLSDADLSDADLSDATTSQTIFNNLDLRHVKGLKTIQHMGPSGITTSTLERSEGDIPDLFLKGAGLNDILITYARSLVQSPIQYYTCFLSYSSQDELFAKRLHNDLQQEGIRCWFAPEDMDIGDKIRHRIDESIRLYDKLLLILSEHAINSAWVAYEVEKALDKEPQGAQNVLYPVRVDKTILTCNDTWARSIKETRHIGNFEHWTNPVQYQDNFKRLLRALNAKKEERKS